MKKLLIIGLTTLTSITASASQSLVCVAKVLQGGHTDGTLLEEPLTSDGYAKLIKTVDNKVIEANARNGSVSGVSIFDNAKEVKAETEKATLSIETSSSKLSVECGVQ